MNTPHRAGGFTLVELMVALTLGMMLSVFVVQIFLQNKKTQLVTATLSDLKADEVFSQYHLETITKLSGYRSAPDAASALGFESINTVYPSSAPYLFATNNTGVDGSDTLTIRFQGSGDGEGTADHLVNDCLNQGVDSFDMATNIFSLTNDNELQCQVQNDTTGTTTTMVLANGIENFQVLVGEDLDSNGSPDRYVAPDTASIDWQQITSVRFALLLRSEGEVGTVDDVRTYNVLGEVINPEDDRRIRRIITRTIWLRNISHVTNI